MSTPTPPAVAYSYIRFSHPGQAKGDSLRRQTEAAAEWCERNGVQLDASITLHDLGKSAFKGGHRLNADRHALAAFLQLVEQGRVLRGSYLILENLDRLTREHIVPALTLLLNLIGNGIRVVQLKPVEQVFDEKIEPFQLMQAVMELSRGHGESAIKSERVGKAWQEKKRRAREEGKVITRRLPAWIKEQSGQLVLIPENAAIVRRLFDLTAAGYGLYSIVKILTSEGVQSFGPSGRWSRAYIALILKDRRAIGEFQPHLKRDGSPDGEPIKNYYPAVVSEDIWFAAREGASQRRDRPGAIGRHLNIFSGLMSNARDGDPYYVATRVYGCKKDRPPQRVLLNAASADGLTPCWSFPFPTFQAAVLSQLAEIDPHAILNGDQGPDESLALAGELAEVESRIAQLEAELMAGDVAALARALRQLEEKKADLAARLADARLKAAHPLSETWGEAQSLLAALDAAPDPQDARLRLRAALRRIIADISVWVEPAGRDRLAAVVIRFKGEHTDRFRGYFICHRPPKASGQRRLPGGWRCESWVSCWASQPPEAMPAGEEQPDGEPSTSEQLRAWYESIRDEQTGWNPLPERAGG